MTSGPESDDSGFHSPISKQYAVPQSRPEAFMVELAQWTRLRARVGALEQKWSPNWLISGASALATLGASTAVAYVALPSGPNTDIDPLVEPILLIAAIACLVVAAVFVALYFVVLNDRKAEGEDIQNEMDTIHSAWKSRGKNSG